MTVLCIEKMSDLTITVPDFLPVEWAPKTPKVDTPVSLVLRQAREMVERGWLQGGGVSFSVSGAPHFCAGVAIHYANLGGVHWRNVHVTSSEPLMVFAQVIGGSTPQDIYAWNDDPARTKDQVLAAFDVAIDRAMA